MGRPLYCPPSFGPTSFPISFSFSFSFSFPYIYISSFLLNPSLFPSSFSLHTIYPKPKQNPSRSPKPTSISFSLSSMDPNASAHEFILNPSALHSVYCDAKGEDHDIIDLGLSLRTLQPEANYHPPPTPHLVGLEPYADVINWPQSNLYLKNSNTIHSSSSNRQDCEEETEVVQSKQRWAYVKVNMDGVIVGRKVCIFEHGCYSSLALQLEDMFGRQCESGLKLFETESEFSLFYKDGDENWRSVGDVPWKQFVEGVKRLRIARKDEAFVFVSQN